LFIGFLYLEHGVEFTTTATMMMMIWWWLGSRRSVVTSSVSLWLLSAEL